MFPFLVGALAVAEERSWGVADWQFILPISALKQWSVKMLVALGTSLVLGVLLPIVIYLGFWWLFERPNAEAEQSLEWRSIMTWSLMWGLSQFLLTSVAAYTGSISNSALRAILMAFAVTLGMLFSIYCGATLFYSGYAHLSGSVPNKDWLWLLGIVVLLVVVQRLAFSNFRERGLPGHRFVFQVLILCLLIACFTLIVREWK